MKKCRNPRNVSDIWRNMVNCENGFIDMEVAFRINFYLSQNEVIEVKNSNHDLDDPNKDHNDLKDDHVSLSKGYFWDSLADCLRQLFFFCFLFRLFTLFSTL